MTKNEWYNHPSSYYAAWLSLILYGLISYISVLWWLTPFFFLCLAVAFFTTSVQPRTLVLCAWCFCGALITLFPCVWIFTQCCRDVLALVCIASFMVLFGTGLFFGAAWCAWCVQKRVAHSCAHLCVFAGMLVFVWWFMDAHFFWWAAPGYGYMLANPLLPLCADARLLALTPHIGTYGLLGFILLGVGGVVQWWYHKKRGCGMFALLVCAAMVAGGSLVPRKQKPGIVASLVALRGEGLEGHSFLATLGTLKTWCDLCCEHLEPNLIVGPESLVSYPLNQAASACVILNDAGTVRSPVIIVGAPWQADDGSRYNAAYCLHEGRIIFHYDKITLLPFFEQPMTEHHSLPLLQGLFNLRKACCYLPGRKDTPSCETTLLLNGSQYTVRLCLCSDLFCGHVVPPRASGMVIALVNDEWFFGSCMADRMLWFATLWAVRHRTPVVYVGYHHAVFIERCGQQWPLARIGKKGLFLP